MHAVVDTYGSMAFCILHTGAPPTSCIWTWWLYRAIQPDG
jgi:hypothetical protein